MILIAYGTRPEYIKLFPLIVALHAKNVNYKTLFTGQHLDLIGDHDPDYTLRWGDNQFNRVNRILSQVVEYAQTYVKDAHLVVVQGDTTSALGVAMCAYNMGIPVAHVEAGLRTWKVDPFPEEANRRMISSLASFHFCPTKGDSLNLMNERQTGKVFVVGNTSIDAIAHWTRTHRRNNTVLITLHRRENHDTIPEWFRMIDTLAEAHPDLKFVLVAHKNPNVAKHYHLLKNVIVQEPQSHAQFTETLRMCEAIITDSGGIQEEANYFGKHCFVCREATERPCTTSILCKTPQELKKKWYENGHVISRHCEFGDGNAGQKIADILVKHEYEGKVL